MKGRSLKRGSIDPAAQVEKKTRKATRGQVKSQPEKIDIDEVGIPDAEAVSMVQKLLDLSDKEAAVLGSVLCKLEDDPLLVFRKNPNWRRRGGASANAILDAIAVYDTPACNAGMMGMAAPNGFLSSETVPILTHANEPS